MHMPGVDYPNRIDYLEITPERLVYWHGDGTESDPRAFHVTVTLAEETGKTRVTLRAVFKTAEVWAENRKFGAQELGGQTLEKLGELVATLK